MILILNDKSPPDTRVMSTVWTPALGPFSTYVAHVLNVLPPEPHRYLPTRAARAARGRKSYLPTYLALET